MGGQVRGLARRDKERGQSHRDVPSSPCSPPALPVSLLSPLPAVLSAPLMGAPHGLGLAGGYCVARSKC